MGKKFSSPIPKRMREIRKLRGFTQLELGVLAGIEDPQNASSRINHYERNTHTPKFTLVHEIAKALGVPTFYLYVEDEYLEEVNKIIFKKNELKILKAIK